MSSSLDKLLAIQEDHDAALSDTANLRTLIEGVRFLKAKACLKGEPTIEDMRPTYSSYVAATYKPFVSVLSQYIRTNIKTLSVATGNSLECAFDSGNSNFIGDLVAVIQFPGLTLADLTPVAGYPILPVPGMGSIRYCAYPGARLFSRINLVINGKVVETYTPDNVMDYVFHEVDIAKRDTLTQCLGQQQPQLAKYSYTFDQWGQPIAPDKQLLTFYTDGAQTPKNAQPPLTLVVPLLFQWTRDAEIAMPDAYMNIKQRNLQFELADMSKIVSNYVDMPTATVGYNFKFVSASVYTRAIFMNSDVAGLFMRKQKTMIRSWRTYKQPFNAAGDVTFSLDAIKYPVECMYVKFVPDVNTREATVMSGANIPTYDYWYIGAKVTKSSLPISLMSVTPLGAMFQNAVTYQFGQLSAIVTSIGMKIQGVDLFNGPMDPAIPGTYIPFLESSILRTAPYPGTAIFNFSQKYQGDFTVGAAGYMDFSLFGDKQLIFTSPVISETYPVTMVIGIKFLNFFEISDAGIVSYTYPVI